MRFDTVLVANRGEIARRVVRAARASGLRCVGVYVDSDAREPFVADCDLVVRLDDGYLDGAALIDAALRSGAGALHPGYGFLSENAEFAAAVQAAGLVWIGPPAQVIAAMGDKVAAKELARAAGLAVLKSSATLEDGDEVGYPLMVKAAAGGGGKGMRVVRDAQHLVDAVAAARREAASSFGDDRVFLERYVAASRHVEIQILGDQYGALVHLGERECSIQRRHQKLVEESPSTIVDESMRAAMGAAALTLAREIGYQSAGTVEFIVDDESREFYFLEVNTRLQVEHPVTEAVTGIDLVREQLRLAAGEPLGYEQRDVHFRGHAIEVRLCAEDPSTGFLPATGTLSAFEPAREPRVRWESGVEAGSLVTVDFDPLLAKVIAHAPTRREAAFILALALERLHLGGVATNRDFLAATLRHEKFLDGDTTTDFIDRYAPTRTLALDDADTAWAATAGALWLQGEHRAHAPVLDTLPSGWRNARLPRQRVTLRTNGEAVEVSYCARRDGAFDVGDGGVARVHEWREDSIDLEFQGWRARVRVTRSPEHLFVQVTRGTVDFEVVPRFAVADVAAAPGGLNAPMPGAILEVRVREGQHVESGATLVVMEAMKMEHVIVAPHAGVVGRVFVAVGEQVANGTVLLSLESVESEDSPSGERAESS